MTTPVQRRDAVLRAIRDQPISQRRACVLIGVNPKTVRREHPPGNPEIRLEMHKIAEKRRRFGYRRIGIMLERKGMVMNEKSFTASTDELSLKVGDGGIGWHIKALLTRRSSRREEDMPHDEG